MRGSQGGETALEGTRAVGRGYGDTSRDWYARVLGWVLREALQGQWDSNEMASRRLCTFPGQGIARRRRRAATRKSDPGNPTCPKCNHDSQVEGAREAGLPSPTLIDSLSRWTSRCNSSDSCRGDLNGRVPDDVRMSLHRFQSWILRIPRAPLCNMCLFILRMDVGIKESPRCPANAVEESWLQHPLTGGSDRQAMPSLQLKKNLSARELRKQDRLQVIAYVCTQAVSQARAIAASTTICACHARRAKEDGSKSCPPMTRSCRRTRTGRIRRTCLLATRRRSSPTGAHDLSGCPPWLPSLAAIPDWHTGFAPVVSPLPG